MTQFAFLQLEFFPVYEHAKKAETIALSDPRSSCFYVRLALETAIKWMYASDKALKTPYDEALSALIYEPSFRNVVGEALVTKARIIKDLGNRAVHDTRDVLPQTATNALRELFHFSYWLVHTYAKGAKPNPSVQFSVEVLPRTAHVETTTLKKLQEIARRFADQAQERDAAKEALLKSEAARIEYQEEINRLQAEIAAIKAANKTASDTHDYNEAQTRDVFIDLLLHEAGWPLDKPRDREFPVTGMPNEKGEGFVDYVLWNDDGKPLALVEAKRTSKDARVGQQQAKLYADCLEKMFGQRPIIFYTNGYDHWIWDDKNYPPRSIQGFLKKNELVLLHQRALLKKPLRDVEIDKEIVERYYQERAIRRIDDTLEKERQRKVLLVMATGSGKTRTVIALIDQLMRANWVKNALFLADRVALVNQAVTAFKKHLPYAAPVNLVTDKTSLGRLYVSTYPTMIGLIDEIQNGVRRFGPGHFDLIVIDEAHRSVYRKYGTIFKYFDSLLVGLTATPRDEIDRDTYSLFEIERGVPTDSYDLEQAVKDGYLVPPNAVSVPLRFQREGIRYDELSDDEKAQWDALDWTEEGFVPEEVEASAINKWLFNKDTVDKMLEHLMTHGIKVEEGDLLGKTIIFAKNSLHAQFIAERFDANYPHLKGHFARVIDYRTPYVQSIIDDFSNQHKSPHIAVSVDMLDTGIDVPEVVNLVFFKVVHSKTKFWQMIGRGTRLCPDLFGPGNDKERFLVFDFCQNFEFFNQNLNLSEGAVGQSLQAKLFNTRLELSSKILEKDNEESLNELHQSLISRLYDEVTGMSTDNFIVRSQRRYVEKYQKREAWSALGEDERSELTSHVAGLPSSYEGDELEAKQFDYLILQAQLAILNSDPSFERHKIRITAIAAQLEELRNVPMVAAEMELILAIQTDDFWIDINLPILENVRHRLRHLIKLIEYKKRNIVYTDFKDQIGAGTIIDLPITPTGTNQVRFKKKVLSFLDQHSNHITILKLKRNEPLTRQDISELERMLLEEQIGSQEELEQVRNSGGLGIFIRSLVGLDRSAAKQAFAEFMNGKSLNANQIEFIDLIINHLTAAGIMEADRLYESPFTDLNDMGVRGIFTLQESKQIEDVLDRIKKNAAA